MQKKEQQQELGYYDKEKYITEAYINVIEIEEVAEKIFGKMRDATEEEKKFSEEYIKENSIPTGVNFWD